VRLDRQAHVGRKLPASSIAVPVALAFEVEVGVLAGAVSDKSLNMALVRAFWRYA
jgi:hypothetical protein